MVALTCNVDVSNRRVKSGVCPLAPEVDCQSPGDRTKAGSGARAGWPRVQQAQHTAPDEPAGGRGRADAEDDVDQRMLPSDMVAEAGRSMMSNKLTSAQFADEQTDRTTRTAQEP